MAALAPPPACAARSVDAASLLLLSPRPLLLAPPNRRAAPTLSASVSFSPSPVIRDRGPRVSCAAASSSSFSSSSSSSEGRGGGEGEDDEEENGGGNGRGGPSDEEVERALGLDESIPRSSHEFVRRVSSRAYDMRRHLMQTIDSISYDGMIDSPPPRIPPPLSPLIFLIHPSCYV